MGSDARVDIRRHAEARRLQCVLRIRQVPNVLYQCMSKWLELAQKMAQAARAGLAIEKKRLHEILAERQRL
jgi:hypothetical protein